MKLFTKKAVLKAAAFIAINKSQLKQVKGGGTGDRRTSSTEID